MKNQKTILAVDDEAAVGRLYRTILSHSDGGGFAVELATGGKEALARISAAHACMILDLRMPDLSGFEVLREVRARPELRGLPVIVVTGSEDEEDGVRALEMGADDYISKPIRPVDVFFAKVKKHIARAEELKLRRAGYSVGA